MAGDDDYILLGAIAKTHGVRGELIIRTANPSFELNENWESIFLRIDGILVPFFISALKFFKPGEWILKLDWYDDRSQAEKLVGLGVWVEREKLPEPEGEIFLDELIDFEFHDATTGRSGRITGFMDIPDNPVFEVSLETKTILVPAREELILEVDAENRKIIFQLPEGL